MSRSSPRAGVLLAALLVLGSVRLVEVSARLLRVGRDALERELRHAGGGRGGSGARGE